MALIIDDTLISNQEQNLRAAMSTDPKMRKVIQHHIREALYEARRDVMASSPLESDPRGAIRSIRTTVYEKILGGNINILNGKKADLCIDGDLQKGKRWFEWIKSHCDFDQLIWEHNSKGNYWVHVSYRADGHNRKQVINNLLKK